MLRTFTATLTALGFTVDGISAEGLQHRWSRGQAVVDVLLPDGIGPVAASRPGVTGSRTLTTPGGTQALQRTRTVAVSVHGREGQVRRPDLVGALVMKAAAHTAVGDPARGRHRIDFATLATVIAARDFRDVRLTAKDRSRLRVMITATRADTRALTAVPDALVGLQRLETAAGLR